MHWPGIEPGPPAWQARILPLNHQCFHVQCSTRGKTDRQRPATNVEVITGHQDRTCAAGAPLETDIDQGPILASIGGGRRGGRGGRRRRIGDGTQPPYIRRRSSMSSPISVIKRPVLSILLTTAEGHSQTAMQHVLASSRLSHRP